MHVSISGEDSPVPAQFAHVTGWLAYSILAFRELPGDGWCGVGVPSLR